MFEGQLLIDKTDAYEVFSPWFRRGGDNAVFSIDVIQDTLISGGGTFIIEIFTKKFDDAGDGTMITTGGWSAATGVKTPYTQLGNMKDLVRFLFKMPGTHSQDWVLFRMLMPQWHDTV